MTGATLLRNTLLSVIAVAASPISAAGLRFHMGFTPDASQLVVQVDTRGLPDNAIVRRANFNARFEDGAGRGHSRSFDFVDNRLPALAPGEIYERRYAHKIPAVRRATSTGLNWSLSAAGGKADEITNLARPSNIDTSGVRIQRVAEPVVVPAPNSQKPLSAAACRDYANSAVTHQATNQARKCQFTGPRWSKNFDHHQNWCLLVPQSAANSETRTRVAMLAGC